MGQVVYNNITSQYQYVYGSGSNQKSLPLVRVSDIPARDRIKDPTTPVYVVDASRDPSVGKGWAIYYWDVELEHWVKMAEEESMDLNLPPEAELFDAVTKRHVHMNLDVLNQFSISINGKIAWKDTELVTETAPDNIIYGSLADVQGRYNVASGYAVNITAYDAATNTIKIALLGDHSEKFVPDTFTAGTPIQLRLGKSDQETSRPNVVKAVTSVDQEGDGEYAYVKSMTLELQEPLGYEGNKTFDPTEEGECAVAVVPDNDRDVACFISGEHNWGVGWNSSTTGLGNINVGDYSSVTGVDNICTGENCCVGGCSNTVTGSESAVYGVNNLTEGRNNFVIGGNNRCTYSFIGKEAVTPTYADDCMIAGMGNESTVIGARIFGFQNRVYGYMGATFGYNNEITVTGKYALALGSFLTIAAPGAIAFGRGGDIPEFEGTLDYSSYAAGDKSGIHYKEAVVFCGGLGGKTQAESKQIVAAYTKYRWVKNPAYPWGTGAAIEALRKDTKEDPYLMEPHDLFRVFGSLRIEGTVQAKVKYTEVAQDAPELDYETNNRFKLHIVDNTGNTSVYLTNWEDGCEGELIVYNGGTIFSIPDNWNVIGEIPALQGNGYDVFEIRQIDTDVFIRHKFAKSN